MCDPRGGTEQWQRQPLAFEAGSERLAGERATRCVFPPGGTREIAGELERRSRAIYAHGETAAAERGIIIADTKFEFGRTADGRILLIDEVLTPDSSRFWPAESYAPGRQQPSFDKQPLRDYLDGERRAVRWNGEAPPPRLPAEIVDATSKRYLDAFRRLTGTPLDLDALA